MSYYQLQIKKKNGDILMSGIVKAETHQQAFQKIKKKDYKKIKRFSDFTLLDNIGIVERDYDKVDKPLDKVS